jgi:serine/threonine protein kinase
LLFEKIIHAEYDFPEPEWTYISDTAKNFIKSLLVLDPKKRLTAEECLEHPFLVQPSPVTSIYYCNRLELQEIKHFHCKALSRNTP